MVAFRKVHLGLAFALSLSAGSATASELNLSRGGTPYTVWSTTLTVETAGTANTSSNLVSLAPASSPELSVTQTKTLDLKRLSLSDFGDVDPR